VHPNTNCGHVLVCPDFDCIRHGTPHYRPKATARTSRFLFLSSDEQRHTYVVFISVNTCGVRLRKDNSAIPLQAWTGP